MKVVFLDRDGVINKDNGYVYKITDFVFIEGIFDSCKKLQDKGFQLIIITNQSGIGRGYYTENDFKIISHWMLQKFQEHNISILDVMYCPHKPEDNCNCRKPNTGMLDKAHEKYQIDKVGSWMIGDKKTDIEAAHSFGIINTVLVNNDPKIEIKKSQAKFVFASILEASQFIS